MARCLGVACHRLCRRRLGHEAPVANCRPCHVSHPTNDLGQQPEQYMPATAYRSTPAGQRAPAYPSLRQVSSTTCSQLNRTRHIRASYRLQNGILSLPTTLSKWPLSRYRRAAAWWDAPLESCCVLLSSGTGTRAMGAVGVWGACNGGQRRVRHAVHRLRARALGAKLYGGFEIR